LLPHQILRFDRETSSEELQREFADLPDDFLDRHDIRLFIHSPSLTSGSSIEGNHFDLCVGIFEGQTIAPDDVLQALARVRKPIPRIVYVSHYGKYDPVIAATRKADYMEQSDRRAKMIGTVLGEAIETRLDDPIAEYHAATQADRNSKMICFGASVRALLERAGCQVTIGTPDPIASGKEWRSILKATVEADRYELAKAEIIDGTIASDLRTKKSLKHADALKLARFDLCDWYEIAHEALSIADVEFDANGNTRRNISRLEGLIWDGMSRSKDMNILDQLRSHNAPIQSHDLPGRELASRTAIALGVDVMITKAIEGDGWHSDTDWVITFAAKIREFAADARLALGFTVNARMSDCQIVGQVLRSFGLSTTSRNMGSDGQRYRLYTIAPESLDRLREILQRRTERHSAKGLKPRTSPLTMLLIAGVYVVPATTPIDMARSPETPRYDLATASHPDNFQP
jgi:hypothetical protein